MKMHTFSLAMALKGIMHNLSVGTEGCIRLSMHILFFQRVLIEFVDMKFQFN